jgi:hypothetical protein
VEEESDVEDAEAAEAEGQASWSMLDKLKLHELKAVADAFLKSDECKNLPQRKAEMASYLAVTGKIPLEHFEVFLSNYRLEYAPPKKKNAKQLDIVLGSVAAQERQQEQFGGKKERSKLQNKFYTVALEHHKEQNGGKFPTPAQVSRLWEAAAQRAHTTVVDECNPAEEGGRRQSKRHKKTLVQGVGYLDLLP